MTFRRARLQNFGPLTGIALEEAELPSPGAGEVLIRVAAAGVNPVDWKLVQGYLRGAVDIPLPYTPGCDVSGEIIALGSGLHDFSVGDKVYGYPSLMRGGAYGEYAILAADECAHAPATVPLSEAAAYPVAAITAHEGLFQHGRLQAGERLLVLGGAGGVGSAAVQMGLLHGAEVFATSSTRNLEMVAGLGAKALDYGKPLAGQVADADLVFDSVGGQAGVDALAVIKRGGRFVTPVYPLPEASLLEALGLEASTYGILPNRKRLEAIRPWIESGKLRMHIDGVFSLSEVVQALERSAQGRTRGKLLVAMAA
jgi:NADPH:quinone reductase-like Zn-dependent oxidoreductase